MGVYILQPAQEVKIILRRAIIDAVHEEKYWRNRSLFSRPFSPFAENSTYGDIVPLFK